MKKLFAALFLIASALFLAPAQAALVTIDFEGVVPNGGESFCPTPYAEDGFTLTSTVECGTVLTNNQFGNNGFGNATTVMGVCAGCSFPPTMLTLAGTGVFSVLSIDLGSHFGSDPAVMQFIGHFSGGGTVTQSIDPTQTWGTYILTGFTGLSSMDIQMADTNEHGSLDNIFLSVSESVPEPASLALLGLGLFGLLGFRRKRA